MPAQADAIVIRTPSNQLGRTAMISIGLHVVIAFLLIFGLPFLTPPPPDIEPEISVDLVTPGPTVPAPPQVKAPQPVEKPAPPKQEEAPPKPEPKPPAPEPPKPAPPTPAPPPPQPAPPTPPPPAPPPPQPAPPTPAPPIPAPPPPPPPPVAAPTPAPTPPPPPKPAEPQKQEVAAPPTPAPPVPVKKPPAPPQQNDMADLLKTVQQIQKSAPQAAAAPTPTQNAPAAAKQTVRSTVSTLSDNVSASDKDAIKAQIEPHWSIDPGAKNASDFKVTIRATVQADGTVTSAQIVPAPQFASNPSYGPAAESARRAVLEASPIKLPPGKADAFNQLTLVFDPKDVIR